MSCRVLGINNLQNVSKSCIMKEIIDINKWSRKEHFEFFNTFDDPFFDIVANVDCTIAYQKAKEQHISFFLYYLYQSLKTVNSIEEFKYRLEDGNVVKYNEIHAAPAIDREDNSFGFSFINYDSNSLDFYKKAKQEIDAVRQTKGLNFTPNAIRNDVVHYSVVPWYSFTSLSHPRNFKTGGSVPKIVFGKYYKENGRLLMPVSINCHHGFMDGYHVGVYFEKFQELLSAS